LAYLRLPGREPFGSRAATATRYQVTIISNPVNAQLFAIDNNGDIRPRPKAFTLDRVIMPDVAQPS
jgi:hypothetical protein